MRGAQLLAELAGERDVLCFDMGGTSCDVCVIHDGEVAETAAGVVAGRPLALATLDIETVGAGGLDRVGGRGRRAARGSALGGRGPGSGVLRTGRYSTDGDGRESAAGPAANDGGPATRCRRPPSARWRGSPRSWS